MNHLQRSPLVSLTVYRLYLCVALVLLGLLSSGPLLHAGGDGSRETGTWRLTIQEPITGATPSPGPDPIPCLPCAPDPTGEDFTIDTSQNQRVHAPLTLQGIYLRVDGQLYALDGSSNTRKLVQYTAGEIQRLEFVDPAGVLAGYSNLFLRLEVHWNSGQVHIQDTKID